MQATGRSANRTFCALRCGRPWTIGIHDPRQPDEVLAWLPLEDTSISVSGDYERFSVDEHGTGYYHLIDPRACAA